MEVDISEGSTNTEEYGTCTETSKRTSQGTKPGTAPAATAQVPGSRTSSV